MNERRRFRFEKIIRDKIPDIMKKKNKQPVLRVLEGDDYILKLKEKLVEEMEEFMRAASPEEGCLELADMLEVIHALSTALGQSYESVEQQRIAKKNEKGGFEGGIYCTSVEMDATNPDVSYYEASPQQYPEIKS